MSIVSRADLLRAFSKSVTDNDLEHLSQALDYEYQVKQFHQEEQSKVGKKNTEINEQEYLPIQALRPRIRFWTVDNVEVLDDEGNENNEEHLNTNLNKTINDEISTNMPYHFIWSDGQWLNCWDRALPLEQNSKKIDVPKAVEQITQNKPVTSLPKKRQKNFNHNIVVITERNELTYPVWSDFDKGWRSLVQLFGRAQVETYWVDQGVANPWIHLESKQRKESPLLDSNIPIVMMGVFSNLENGELDIEWLKLLRQYQKAGHKISIISCAPITIPFELCNDVTVCALDDRHSSHHEQLLTAMSLAWSPRIKQIRKLRLAITECSLADELLAFQSPELDKLADDQRKLKTKYLRNRLLCLSMNKNLEKAVQKVIYSWKGYLGEIQIEIEQFQGELLKNPHPSNYPRLLKLVKKKDSKTKEVKQRNNRLIQSIMPQLQLLNNTNYNKDWQTLLDEAKKIADNSGDSAAFNKTEHDYYLHQHGRALILNQQKSGALFHFIQKPMYANNWETVDNHINTFNNTVSLLEEKKKVTLKNISKPNWADRIWQNTDGLFAVHQDGTEFQLIPANHRDESALWRDTQGTHNAWSWASDYGIDDYGLWVVLTIEKVDFKFRWIPKGTFLMGSPEDEDGRYDDETQHEVTLTQGYWLAETSVTQAQWIVITGKNPSEEPTDNDLPVNKVSWDDCQIFIEKLKLLMADFNFRLPTEAQWEYACRAGSQKAYWWGDEFDQSKANHLDSIKAESNMPQNSFGLRSMSGNLYEWCNDLNSEYNKQAVIDPKGATDGSDRVLRGGSWIGRARNLRSAYRNAFTPDFRYHFIGLRLAGGFDPQAGNKEAMLTADRRRGAEPVRRQSSLVDEAE